MQSVDMNITCSSENIPIAPVFSVCQKSMSETDSSSMEKDLGLVVDERLDVNKRCLLSVQEANSILGCIKRSMVSRPREVSLPLSGED